jgi:hypothetical protein
MNRRNFLKLLSITPLARLLPKTREKESCDLKFEDSPYLEIGNEFQGKFDAEPEGEWEYWEYRDSGSYCKISQGKEKWK